MLRGSIEYNKIIREFDKDLVSEVFDYDYRPIILKITEYYSRHKATPTINILKKILSEAIDNETKIKPLTDEKLPSLLKEKGYNIARRTVAKYREQLNIPVARLRKEL